MSDLSNSKLRRLDLTLLLIFLGLLRHRKSSAVALDLGLTQSAISQALRRLRDVFGDELFLRRPHGMEPTATALALEVPVADAVNVLRGALGTARSFEPTIASGVVRLAALHAEQAVLIPGLFARLRHAAPGLALSILPKGRKEAVQALKEDRADFALGFFRDIPNYCSSQVLYNESYLVVGRPDILIAAPNISLEAYCAADHLLTAPGGGRQGIVDTRLAQIGHKRRVLLSLPAFLPALAATKESGALLTLPSKVALKFAEQFGLVTVQPPLELPGFPVSILWHRRNDNDPKTLWLKNQISPS
ncbi:MAG: LysR family transcriptional regulator [Roseibium sp.]|nr:LysR family transcriptional regulator [Roseibium sp.]